MSIRTDRVGEAIREVLAAAVADLTDPRLGLVTITGVDVAPDLKNATVFFSTFGGEDELSATGDALNHAAGRLQRAVARGVRMKSTPHLQFEADRGILEGERIDAMLRGLDDADASTGDDGV